MKRSSTLLMLALALLVVFALDTQAAYYPRIPTGGIQSDDQANDPSGGHPWGGDESSGNGDIGTRSRTTAVASGITTVDYFVGFFINHLGWFMDEGNQRRGSYGTVYSERKALVINRDNDAAMLREEVR